MDIVSKAELKIHPSLNIRQLSTHNDVTRVNVLHLHVTYCNRFLFFITLQALSHCPKLLMILGRGSSGISLTVEQFLAEPHFV